MSFTKVQPTGASWATNEVTGTSISATLTSAPTVGNLVVAIVALGGPATGCAVKDGNSNTYTSSSKTGTTGFGGNGQTVGVWYWAATGTPSSTITFTLTSGSTQIDIWVAEFSGNMTPIGSVFDNDATTANAAETNVILPSGTPAGAGELFVAGLGTNGSTTSANSPWTAVETSIPASGNFAEYYINAGSGAQAVAFTTTSGSNAVILAMFKPTTVVAVGVKQYDSDLPARRRGPPDIGTAFQSGYISHGPKAQNQYDNALPPFVY